MGVYIYQNNSELAMQNAYIGEYGWKPNANTLLYYPLTQNADDQSGNGNNGTAYNATFSETGGVFLIGTNAAGSNGKIETPNFSMGTTYTVNTWVKFPVAFSGSKYVGFQVNWSGPNRYIFAIFNSSGIQVTLGNGGSSEGTNMTWSTSFGTTWHNVCMVRNGTSIIIYYDGVSLGEEAGGSYNVAPPNFRFGIDSGNGASYSASSYFKDYIMENGIWTADEVAEYYNQTKSKYGIS